ncbi:MAG: NADH:ubiquinone oxidoreductase [Candidatus Makaraimicrobium thalassicum]|nr:MAG: NADH:ubiquinone oxidoreductase [Candidatus Omnitrophota bacterium]
MIFLAEHAPAFAIAVPLLAAFVTPVLGRISEKIRNIWVIFSLLFTEFLVFILGCKVLDEGVYTYALGAVTPSLTSPVGFPVRIILETDAMNALISFMVLSIAIITVVYSWKFIEKYEAQDRFYSLLLLLTAGMMGMSFTGDFFTMFVFLEVVSVSSAALVAFFKKAESFEAAFKYLAISSIGSFFMLFGIGLLYGHYGLLNMAVIAKEIILHYSFLDVVALSLLGTALLLKLGSVPIHMWKVDSLQEAPAPVSVVCIATSLVGLYLLFRIGFSVFGLVINSILGWILVFFGILSIFIGVAMALLQNNLKRLLGYSAVAEVGYILLGAGVGLSAMPEVNGFAFEALSGGIFHIVNDVLDISLLFLIAGSIYYITKKRNIDELGGLAHDFPSLSVLFIIGMLAISGIPPFNGFASKLMIYESVFYFNPLLVILGVLGSILMLAVFVKVFACIFLGAPYEGEVEEVPGSMMFTMWVLAFFILFLGLFPQVAIDIFIAPAAEALVHPEVYIGGVL